MVGHRWLRRTMLMLFFFSTAATLFGSVMGCWSCNECRCCGKNLLERVVGGCGKNPMVATGAGG